MEFVGVTGGMAGAGEAGDFGGLAEEEGEDLADLGIGVEGGDVTGEVGLHDVVEGAADAGAEGAVVAVSTVGQAVEVVLGAVAEEVGVLGGELSDVVCREHDLTHAEGSVFVHADAGVHVVAGKEVGFAFAPFFPLAGGMVEAGDVALHGGTEPDGVEFAGGRIHPGVLRAGYQVFGYTELGGADLVEGGFDPGGVDPVGIAGDAAFGREATYGPFEHNILYITVI